MKRLKVDKEEIGEKKKIKSTCTTTGSDSVESDNTVLKSQPKISKFFKSTTIKKNNDIIKTEDKNKVEPSTLSSSKKNNVEYKKETLIKDDNGAYVYYIPKFLNSKESKTLFQLLLKNSNFTKDIYTIHGKTVESPRLVASYSDSSDITYHYTGMTRIPQLWFKELLELKERIENYTGEVFNFALVNKYENGDDYIGWHADKVKDFAEGASIASISLGCTRTFQFREMKQKKGMFCSKDLVDGSLVVMNDKTQLYYKHCIPKRANIHSVRLNITFRNIKPIN
ncbi:hypothetical protein ABK040_004352 [Willaertia magna]